MPASRQPTRRRGATTRRSKGRARRPPTWRERLPVLDQRHFDLIGLGLFAAGVFLAFPLYLGWDAGVGGSALVDGLLWLFGRVAYVIPFGGAVVKDASIKR